MEEIQNNGATTPNESTQAQPTIDYEQEYKKLQIEVEKQKKLKDNYAKENAEYKKKELEKMTDDEKKAKEYQDLVESNTQLAERLKQFELKDELLQNGFTAQESDTLIKTNMSIKTFADILKTRIDEAVKSATAGMIKTSTPQSPTGSGNVGDGLPTKSDYQKYQDSKKPHINEVKLK